MQTYTSQPYQTVFDLCTIVYGSLDYLGKFLFDNDLSVGSNVPNGTVIKYENSTPLSNNIATGLSPFDSGDGVTSVTISSNLINVYQWSNPTVYVTAVGGTPTYQWQYSTDSGVTWTNCSAALFPGSVDITLESYFYGYTTNTLEIENIWSGMSNWQVRCQVGPDLFSPACVLEVNTYNEWVQNYHDTVLPEGETVNPAQLNALQQLCQDLWGVNTGQSYEVTDQHLSYTAIYPMMGSDQATLKVDIVGGKDLTFADGVLTSSLGLTFTGSNYADTGIVGTTFGPADLHFSIYSQADPGGTTPVLGGCPSSTMADGTTEIKFASAKLTTTANDHTEIAHFTSASGLNIVSRTSSTNVIQQNRASSFLATSTSLGLSSPSKFMLGQFDSENSAYTCSFSSLGSGLTNDQCLDLWNAVQNFQTMLSRAV